MKDLLPFAIVTLIVLVAFSFMYYIQNFGDEGYETFKDAFYSIFTQFFGGPEGATGPLDLIFGILSVVILLNVVIAIVSTSWENAVDTSLILLCKYRLELLRQVDALMPSKGFQSFQSLKFVSPDYDEDYDRFVETRILPLIRPEYRGEEWWHLELSEEEVAIENDSLVLFLPAYTGGAYRASMASWPCQLGIALAEAYSRITLWNRL
jgi:hypothetical protein